MAEDSKYNTELGLLSSGGRSAGDTPTTPLEAALEYKRRGFAPTPNHPRTKAARLREWDKTKLGEPEIREEFATGDGPGLVLGEMSGGLLVVDLDSELAVRLGRAYLPETGMLDGRPKKPDSHWFYRADPLPAYRSFKSPKLGGATVVELLSGAPKARQVVVPPSLLPDGEQRAWSRFGEPAVVDAAELVERLTRLAVHHELLLVWPEGGRHESALALAGGLLRLGWDEEDVEELIETLCPERWREGEVAEAVRDTARRVENGENVTGWPTLARLTGEAASVDAICDWLGVGGFDRDDDRPRVEVVEDLAAVSDNAWAGVRQANDPPVLFRRSNQPFRVERIDDSDTVVLVQLNDVRLRHHLAEMLRWWEMTRGGPAATKPPIDVVRNMLAEEDIPLPIISRVVTVPVFAPNGVLQTEPGYHPEAKVYYEPPAGLVIPAVPERPTGGDVERARALLLDELLADFPFVDDADRAHALALAVLPFVRDLIDGPTPLHLFEAAKQGTGKGLLVTMLTSIFTGGEGASETPLSTSEEEVRKNLFSMLLEGRAFVLLDNLTGTISSAALSVALTSTTYSDRKLGVSETPYVSVRCGWVGTANNAALDADLTRRTIRSRMVAQVENPWERPAEGFRHPDLLGWSKEHRGELVWAVLTLVQSWIAEGRPDGKRTLGSYEAWSRVVGGVLDAAGVPGFLGNLHEFYADANTEGSSWRQFVEAWWERFGLEPKSATDLLYLAGEAGFRFEGWRDDDKKRELGTKLRGQKDNIYAGFAIRQGTNRSSKSNSYRLEPREGQAWTAPERETGAIPGAIPLAYGRGSAGPAP